MGPFMATVLGVRDPAPKPSLTAKIGQFERAYKRITAIAERSENGSLDDHVDVLKQIFGFALGNTRRSCSAYFAVGKGTRVAKVGEEFVGRRGGGNLVPNRARRRARDSAHACMKADFNGDPNAASLCRTTKGVIGYEIRDLHAALQSAARRVASPGSEVDVYGTTHGNRGCGRKENRRMVIKLGKITVGR